MSFIHFSGKYSSPEPEGNSQNKDEEEEEEEEDSNSESNGSGSKYSVCLLFSTSLLFRIPNGWGNQEKAGNCVMGWGKVRKTKMS